MDSGSAVATAGLRTPGSASAANVHPPAARVAVWRFSVPQRVLILGVYALLAVPFWMALVWLWRWWTALPEYSHGPLLPAVAAFIAWQSRDRLEQLSFRGSWAGVALVVLAGAGYVLGLLGSAHTLQQYALVVAIAGVTLALVGRPGMTHLVVPVVVLALAVPQPQFVLANLSSQLQLWSSAIGVAFIRALGIAVFLEGNVIDLGTYRLQVVEACAGLRYLFPLMAIGLLVAYFYRGALWKRCLVFALSVPITILMNSLRIGTIGVMVEHWGVGMAEGFLHEFQGWAVFMLSAALLVGATALLNRVQPDGRRWRDRFGLELPAATPAGAEIRRRTLPLSFVFAAIAVAAIALAGVLVQAHDDHPPARTSFANFPMRLGAWTGQRQTIDPQILAQLEADDYLLADYVAPGQALVDVYVAWYDSQRDRRAAHSPRSCLPGGGWRIEQSETRTVGPSGREVNRLVIANGNVRQLVWYWFDQRGRSVTNEYAVKWFLFWDSVTRSRTDGAMVRLITPLGPLDSPADADARLEGMLRELEPLLSRYVPR